MQNLTLSEMMHTFPFGDFQISGDFDKDIAGFIEHKKMPLSKQNIDSEPFVFALLRLSFGKSITVHILTDGVVEKVKHTKIENVPNQIPNLMKNPFLIEARNDKPLFDNVYSIGGFVYKDEICLIVKTVENNEPGLFCQHEKASFDGRKLDDLNLIYNQNFNQNLSYIKARTRKDTFAFIILLSLILEAERTPLLIESLNSESRKKGKALDKSNDQSSWITRRVYIDRNIKYTTKNYPKDHIAFDKDGKQLKKVPVSGFLRKQHYGKDNSLEKYIYVEDFDSSRWKSEKDKKIIVDIYDKNQNKPAK